MNKDLRDYLLALLIGLVGGLLIAHFAACEQYEGFCSIVGK